MIFLIPWWLAILWTYTDAFPRPFDDWKNTLFYVGAGIAIIVVMLKQITTSRQKLPRVATALLITYLTLAITSLLMTPTARYEGLLELARLILWLGTAWLFAQLTPRQWLWFMRITVISAAAIAALTWLQAQGTMIWPYSGVFLAPIGHITYYGDFMALSLVMSIGLAYHSSAIIMRSLWIVCIIFIIMGLGLSATRASLVGLIIATALAMVLFKKTSWRKTAFILLLAAIGFSSLLWLPVNSLRGQSAASRLFTSISKFDSDVELATMGRWHSYVTSAQMALQHPILGWGIGSFRFVYPEFAHQSKQDELVSSSVWYMHPHNEILHHAVEMGVLGAALFIFGFGYLLYIGIRALDDHNRTLLITALCGLTVAFVSWQFSTNFLFPVSRLMTALFAGMVLQLCHRERSVAIQSVHTGLLRGLRPLAMTTVTLSTLFLLANQISIYCVQHEQMSPNPRDKRNWAAWAVRLAPGAFDPLYIQATVALQTLPPAQAAPAVETLYHHYPYVPAVLHMMGYLRAQQGNIPEARKLLQHALANDPANAVAKQLLDQLPPAH